MKITFLGGAGTVTGSKTLLALDGQSVLVDCGLFQGLKELRLKNWAPLPISPKDVDAVVLTHAHIDHSGYLPLFVKNGFKGPIVSTQGTAELCKILLPDSAMLQEKDAEFANRHAFSKHHPALPLYTRRDAEKALRLFHPIAYDTLYDLNGRLKVRFLSAGHILGAAMAKISWKKLDGTPRSLICSGDLGRPNDLVMTPPQPLPECDYLIVESTYGNRLHDNQDMEKTVADIITRTAKRGGTVLIPAFAVGRAQLILTLVHRLKKRGSIPDIPVFLDSPMAISASEIFRHHPTLHRLSATEAEDICSQARYARTPEQSIALDHDRMAKIVISASGMATGGRVLHHLKHMAPDRRNTLLFTGFQAPGTRGDTITQGATSVKIHGRQIPIQAEVHNLQMLSAHADQEEIMDWLKTSPAAPKMTYVNHGNPEASETLRARIQKDLGWACAVGESGRSVTLP
ncbi:MBL fold metallo-hydrolase RNA specificity domain-containing protein [Varunaivibrio sulfuroxidans]|uniref:Metallo-beta-lactamase family protein n=1 Tax=Varunaivibrio sulfuroxidans TaxID=1773489 RepID=A0A4R3J2V1_9PROT|nr:MBL fold metallo-hydrolase [Varunaivibrio sulfuroxidans]TCS60148.1 metallo-beta-lactamase family protein [Varunaivibrio sulfuroxidans]WES30880.1 MBL fold metallo-hydrolase [Varunaivibrio sulfuroxidans]